MNQELGNLLALGRTAEVYSWQEGWIIKLFFDWFELDDILFEQRMSRAVFASGLPVPEPGEIVQVNGRNGLVYRQVEGLSMWKTMAKKPWNIFLYARKSAELHAEMHENSLQPDIPSQRSRLQGKINAALKLPLSSKQDLISALSSLPEGRSICHGDFHPDNILLSPTRATVIDWIDASLGNPLADVARTSIILLGGASSDLVKNPVLKVLLKLFHSVYLQRYFQLRPGGEAEYHRWLPIVAAARLNENIAALEGWLLQTAGAGEPGILKAG
jgi:Ser/Thr protein kinase RdoA (MazF antagonist)